jgi:prophage regulatory protein
MKLLSYDDLKPVKGVPYSKVQLWRKEKVGDFPKRVRLGGSRDGWVESEIDEWIAARIAARDSANKAT